MPNWFIWLVHGTFLLPQGAGQEPKEPPRAQRGRFGVRRSGAAARIGAVSLLWRKTCLAKDPEGDLIDPTETQFWVGGLGRGENARAESQNYI